MKKDLFIKIWRITKQKRAVRTLLLLDVICIFLIFIFISMASGYREKTAVNIEEKVKNEELARALEKLALAADIDKDIETNILISRSFADFEEVIPFIAFLESIFSEVDENAEITIKSKEDRIFLDHYADYSISLKMNDKADLFLRGLDEIYNSRFIIEFLNFQLDYKAEDITGSEKNKLDRVEMVLRLYLK